MSTLYSVGLMNQLGDALEAAGYSPDDVTKLRSSTKLLENVKSVLEGLSKITLHVIDFETEPYLPDGWSVESHAEAGPLQWDPKHIKLFLSPRQRNGEYITGHELREELKGIPVYNANLLDYLLNNPELIPNEWKGKVVEFWGTIFRDSNGFLCVTHLLENFSGHWVRGNWKLNSFFDDTVSTAVFTSN